MLLTEEESREKLAFYQKKNQKARARLLEALMEVPVQDYELVTKKLNVTLPVIRALEEAGIRDQVKVMIGGAPVSQGFADEIGADGYSDNANTAVAVAKVLMGKRD